MMGRTAMADWYENDRMWTLTNGADVTCTMAAAAAVTDGDQRDDDGFAVSRSGDWRGVHRPRRVSVPPGDEGFAGCPAAVRHHGRHDRDPDGSPPIYLTGPKQNVCSQRRAKLTTATFDGTGIVPVFVGAAFDQLRAEPDVPQGSVPVRHGGSAADGRRAKCVRRVQDGLSMRVWQASDIRNDELLMRIDILYGFAALRPEWACRMIGAASA
jgi:hypothetical protein